MVSKAVSAYMAKLAKRKAAKMTPEERTALALKMNLARWSKTRGPNERFDPKGR